MFQLLHPTPDFASLNPGYKQRSPVARVERSETRDHQRRSPKFPLSSLRQDYHSIDRERLGAACLPHCGAQCFNLINQKARISIHKRYGEEKCSAREEIPTVLDHAPSYPGFRSAQSGLQTAVPQ
jgi:hypothetical protein